MLNFGCSKRQAQVVWDPLVRRGKRVPPRADAAHPIEGSEVGTVAHPHKIYLPPLNIKGTDIPRHHKPNSTLNLKKSNHKKLRGWEEQMVFSNNKRSFMNLNSASSLEKHKPSIKGVLAQMFITLSASICPVAFCLTNLKSQCGFQCKRAEIVIEGCSQVLHYRGYYFAVTAANLMIIHT